MNKSSWQRYTAMQVRNLTHIPEPTSDMLLEELGIAVFNRGILDAGDLRHLADLIDSPTCIDLNEDRQENDNFICGTCGFEINTFDDDQVDWIRFKYCPGCGCEVGYGD